MLHKNCWKISEAEEGLTQFKEAHIMMHYSQDLGRVIDSLE